VKARPVTLLVVLAAILAAPLAVDAQPPKVARIGYLVTGSLESPEAQVILNAFRQGLRERGYVEGQNILIVYRGAGVRSGSGRRWPGRGA